ncbi:hypothetical protein F0U61_29440 [Archangium violaceum]|uniref:cupredoxin domain-containing protein n=1 Tax=Archangium violaceum TaxID=83451 RepID=UPI002B28132E|nr:hypothetical protein F0U61_29440 [Archangium violaceum]
MRARLLCFVLCLSACKGPLPEDFRPVQESATGEPRFLVSLNRITAGRYRAIAPTCIGQRYFVNAPGTPIGPVPGSTPVRPGQIVEFRNYQPDVPTNVTSLSAPASLFSPNLVRPYNIRIEGKETFSYWRYAFPEPGTYEYFDTNMGQPGRQIVDSYYGTVTYIGESNAPKAVVCVDPQGCVASAECLAGTAPAGTVCCSCVGVCCDGPGDEHCTEGKTCLRGRCVDEETGE